MTASLKCLLLAAVIGVALSERTLLQQPGGATAENNYNPATIVVDGGDVIATPITPNAPYSQAALQCNVSGDSRIPGYSTYPLTVQVPKGKMVRVIFANGNLGGATVTQQGEPGVIVQQSGAVIVQQTGSASPVVQNVSSPVVQQTAPPAALVVQQAPTTVVQQPQYSPAPVVQQAPSINQNPPASPTPTPKPNNPPPSTTTSTTTVNLPNLNLCSKLSWLPVQLPCSVQVGGVGINLGKRKLLQDTVPGGPNNGQVEYVALAQANSVPGFVVPNTQFGVPYVEFTASDAAVGQLAVFKGALEVAVVVGGVPQYPFTPNKKYSPECQVNVNFQVV